jgi:DNA replication protein DnaC
VDETLTVLTLHLSTRLQRSLATTNVAESLFSCVFRSIVNEDVPVELFVGVLGASGLIYAEATRSQALTHPTIEKLHALHLTAMATAFEQQRSSSHHAELSFEDRLGLLVDTEWTARESRRLAQRVRHAKLRYPASLEDIDFSTPRGLSREVVLSLGTGGWIRDHHHLLITGPTDIGKSWLASAFVQSACRHGFTATYVRAPRLLHDLAVSRGDDTYGRLLAKLAKLDLLAIDDWLLAPLTDVERRDLLEVLEDQLARNRRSR